MSSFMTSKQGMNFKSVHLWSNVVWSAAECFGGVIGFHVGLAHAEVGDLDVAVLVEHDVVQLEVTVHHAQGMEENYSNSNLRRIETVNKIL